MGKINVEVDTEKKKMDIKVEGKAVPNVREVYAYQSFDSKGAPDGFSMSITTVDSSSDIRKITTYMASGSAEAREAENEGRVVDRSIPGFVGVNAKTLVQKDIESYLSTVLGK